MTKRDILDRLQEIQADKSFTYFSRLDGFISVLEAEVEADEQTDAPKPYTISEAGQAFARIEAVEKRVDGAVAAITRLANALSVDDHTLGQHEKEIAAIQKRETDLTLRILALESQRDRIAQAIAIKER